MNNSLEVEGGMLQEVQDFYYLGESLESEARAERAMRARVASLWSKWKEIESLQQ